MELTIPQRQLELVLATLMLSLYACSGPESDCHLRGEFGLTSAELAEITNVLREDYPDVALSTGLKYVRTSQYGPLNQGRSLSLIFHPHQRSDEMDWGLEFVCAQDRQDRAWDCLDAGPRGYLRVAGEDRDIQVHGIDTAADARQLVALAQSAVDDLVEESDLPFDFPSAHIVAVRADQSRFAGHPMIPDVQRGAAFSLGTESSHVEEPVERVTATAIGRDHRLDLKLQVSRDETGIYQLRRSELSAAPRDKDRDPPIVDQPC